MFESLPQPGIPQEHADLVADGREHLDLLVVELPPALPPDQVKPAGGFLVHGQRNHQRGLMRKEGEETIGESSIARRVVSPHGPPVVEQHIAKLQLADCH